jgi:hypothetical protein
MATREHLATMQRALEARLADALRRQADLMGQPAPETVIPLLAPLPTVEDVRSSQIDAELAALKKELES